MIVPEEYPFVDGMVEKKDTEPGRFTKIFEFKNNPGWIVKRVHRLKKIGIYGRMKFEDFNNEVGQADRDLKKFGNKLMRFVPDHSLIFEKDLHGHGEGFIAMKKVDGVDISREGELPLEFASELEDLIESVVDFYENMTREDGKIGKFPDLFPPQDDGERRFGNIMWGTVDGKKGLFLVDIYPLMEYSVGAFSFKLREAEKRLYEEKNIYLEHSFIEKMITRLENIRREQSKKNPAD